MAKARKSKVISLSLPPEAEAEFLRLAQELGKSRSELFREMLEVYRVERELAEFRRLQRYGADRAAALGIHTEEDVVKLIHEFRGVTYP